MSLWVLLGLAILCVAADARAERAIEIDAGDAPFTASELRSAIRVRVPEDGARIVVVVTTTARGVRIEAAGGAREIDLVGLHGASAARLVALAADDLLPDEVARSARSSFDDQLRGRSGLSIGVLGAVASWDRMLGNLAIDLAARRERWLGALELGGGALIGGPIHLTAGIVRLDAGWHTGWFEARVGVTAAPVFVSDGAGDRTVLFGGNASVRARIPLGAALLGVVAVGLDAMATRTVYQSFAMDLMTTPRLAPWVALGVEVGP